MDTRFTAPALDAERVVTIELGSTDLSPFVAQATQRPNELGLTLRWHHELFGAGMPRPGQSVTVRLSGQILWTGTIESLAEMRQSSGERRLSLTARSRDALPAWRSTRRVTDLYPLGTRLDVIARDVAAAVGLDAADFQIPPLEFAVPHSNLQLADLSAWEMLETLLLPAGYSPFVDGLGRLRARSRDLGRVPDVVLAPEQIVAVTGSRGRTPVTALQLRWLDPQLTEVAQQDQVLAHANITAGFFQIEQRQDVHWSDDRTQRARATRLVVKQSANSGILPVCSEDYAQTAHTGGVIVLKTAAWVPGLVGVFLAVKAAGALPDIAPTGGGPTVTIGKQAHAALELSVLLTMASIGTGVYEIWGTPFDYVHGRNTTEAFDAAATLEAEVVETLDSDLIVDDAHARAVAARELVYRSRSSTSYGVTTVDDPRIEPGDLISLPDGSRLYVTHYTRDLSPGAPATLALEGFQV